MDTDKQGKDGDHDVVVLAPVSNQEYRIERKKRTIITRPLPQSQILNFEKAIVSTDWEHVFNSKNVDEKVEIFHHILRTNLDKYFPDKVTRMGR